MSDREQMLNLKHGEHYTVPESDYGRAEIWFINDRYFLFSIPIYGGQPEFEAFYTVQNIDLMITTYQSWT
jgi:hypothetical protein